MIDSRKHPEQSVGGMECLLLEQLTACNNIKSFVLTIVIGLTALFPQNSTLCSQKMAEVFKTEGITLLLNTSLSYSETRAFVFFKQSL
jgi:hypothetical protein